MGVVSSFASVYATGVGANMLDPPMQPTYIATCTRRVSPGQYENMSREEAIQGSLADCPKTVNFLVRKMNR